MRRAALATLVFTAATAMAATALAKPPAKAAAPAEPAWLGIAMARGAAAHGGAKVTDVIGDTPAERAGIKIDDEIVSLDGRVLAGSDDLMARLKTRKVGAKVQLLVVRGSARLKLAAILAARIPDDELPELLMSQLVDRRAPAFDLPAVSGVPAASGATQPPLVDLKALKGKVVIVEFMMTWCGPCKTTYAPLSKLRAARSGDGLVVLGVGNESEAALKALATQESIDFPILRDATDTAFSAYHAQATPTIVVIDRDGVVRFAGMGAGVNFDSAVFAAERLLDRDAH